ncbi:MAG: DUF2079 domain-containing protein [Spirochaetota bacterium]
MQLFLKLSLLIFLCTFFGLPQKFANSLQGLAAAFYFCFFVYSCKKPLSFAQEDEHPLLADHFFVIAFLGVTTWHYLDLVNNYHRAFFLVDTDFISIAEVLQNTWQGNFFRTHYHGNPDTGNFLAHHFSPALVLLCPFLALSDFRLGYAYGLLFYQIVATLLFYRILECFHLSSWEKLCWLFLFLCNIYVYRLFHSLHFESLFLCFFFLFFLAWIEKKQYLAFFAFLLCLFTKEDISIYLAFLSTVFCFTSSKKKWSSLLLLTSILHYFVLIPLLRQQIDTSAAVNWLENWQHWGNSYIEIIASLLHSPQKVLQALANNSDLAWQFVVLSGGTLLFAPRYFPMLLAIFAIHSLSARQWHNRFYNYYCYSILPFFCIASLEGYLYLKEKLNQHKRHSLVLLCLVTCLYQASRDKLTPLAYKKVTEERWLQIQSIAARIPAGKAVHAQFDLSGWIYRKNPVYPLRDIHEIKDYVILDLDTELAPFLSKQQLQRLQQQLEAKGQFRLIAKWQKVYLYQKKL